MVNRDAGFSYAAARSDGYGLPSAALEAVGRLIHKKYYN